MGFTLSSADPTWRTRPLQAPERLSVVSLAPVLLIRSSSTPDSLDPTLLLQSTPAHTWTLLPCKDTLWELSVQLGSSALLSASTATPSLTLTESSAFMLIRFLLTSRLFINYVWAQPLPKVLKAGWISFLRTSFCTDCYSEMRITTMSSNVCHVQG